MLPAEWLTDVHKVLGAMQGCLLCIESQEGWDGEITQCLGTLTTLAQDPALAPSTHMAAYNQPYLILVPGDLASSGLQGHQTHTCHMCIHADKALIT